MSILARALGGVPVREHVRAAVTGDRSRITAVVGFTAALGLVAVSLVLPVASRAPILGAAVPWWVFVLLYAATEAFPVDLEVGRETHSFSLRALPLVLGLALLTPGELVTAQAVGASIALVMGRRRPLHALAVDVARLAFGTAVAVHVFGGLVDPADPLGPRTWLAVFAAALMADMTASLSGRAAIAIATGERPDSTGVSVRGELHTLASTTLGLVALVLVVREPAMWWLAAPLALAMYAAYRVSAREQVRHRRLQALHAATRGLQDSLSYEQVIRRALLEARAMFGAEWADLIVLPAHDGLASTRRRVSEDHGPARPVPASHVEILWRGLAVRGRAQRLATRDAPEGLRPALETEGIRELVAAPIALDGASGLLVVANPAGHPGAWPADEVAALETLADHAAVALRNAELLEDAAARATESALQARHDPLTGLPTRAWFQELLVHASQGGRPPSAVLCVEVDGFAEVTERLGHENGDLMLREVAGRLTGILGPGEEATRLGGERFALSLAGDPAEAHARSTAERAVRSLEQPVRIDGLPVSLSATVGIALVERDLDPVALLRRADRAMAFAREARTAIELYTPDHDPQGPLRLALVSEVREALDAGAIEVWYQPRLSMASGRVTGAEALARWMHPTQGAVSPALFLPIVEQTRLIRPLTLSVLGSAVASCAGWAAAGHPLAVSVNLSPRNLLDADLAADVRRILADAALPPRSLIVEVTESAVTADHQRAHAILSELRGSGIRVAIDDFGTGYSSLTRLRQLPVDEIKLDRSFVTRIEHDPDDQAIVRAVIGLAHDLGRTVVAEGVETRACWDWLAQQGCDEAQGNLMGRPMPGADLEASLGGRPVVDPRVPLSRGATTPAPASAGA